MTTLRLYQGRSWTREVNTPLESAEMLRFFDGTLRPFDRNGASVDVSDPDPCLAGWVALVDDDHIYIVRVS